jgi:hypothetical protein
MSDSIHGDIAAIFYSAEYISIDKIPHISK